MGIYLSTPSTEVNSESGQGAGLAYAAGEMQGWRKNMEDAHITYTGLATDVEQQPISVFGVFDGHGGKEVAKFVKLKYAEVLLNLPSFQDGHYEVALKQSFHKIDDLLEDDQFDPLLKSLRALPNPSDKKSANSTPAPSSPLSPVDSKTKKEAKDYLDEDDEDDKDGQITNAEAIRLIRELLLGKKSTSPPTSGATTPSTILSDEDDEDDYKDIDVKKSSKDVDNDSTDDVAQAMEKLSHKENHHKAPEKSADNSQALVVVNDDKKDSEEEENNNNKANAKNNFDEEKYDDHKERHLPAPASKDDSALSNAVTEAVNYPPASIIGSKGQYICNLKDHRVLAGCTAIVALLVGNRLIVANAGDSRGVLSRQGVAYALSEDHKPQADIEFNRIKSAGGFVNAVGRINGNLNLSRSLGDLKYKSLKHLPPEAQIITAEPDIKVVEIQEEDEFFILGCDGIWDVLTNQEAIDFVRERFLAGKSLEAITHDVMKRCLADDPKVSQGIGGDNMTFLVVNLKAQALSPEKKLNASEGKDNDDDLSSCPSLSPMSEDGKSADSSL